MSIIAPFPTGGGRPNGVPSQTGFDRAELTQILNLYGRMVARRAIGAIMQWIWSVTMPASPRFAVPPNAPKSASKNALPLRTKQGMWALYGEAGQVLKRGHELTGVLAPVERRLIKIAD